MRTHGRPGERVGLGAGLRRRPRSPGRPPGQFPMPYSAFRLLAAPAMRVALPLCSCLWTAAPAHLPAQGVASSHAQPVRPLPASGLPWRATFTDFAREAGLDLAFTYGDRDEKRCSIESNGSGVAFLDYDGDARLDAFLVNGSVLEAAPEDDAPTSRRYCVGSVWRLGSLGRRRV